MHRLLLTVFIVTVIGYAQAETTVAISDFQNRTNKFHLDSWEEKIPDFLQTELSQSSRLILLERQNIKAVLEEQALTMAGLVDADTAQQVGKLLGAEYVITGTISESGSKIRIDAKVIQVATGKVISEKVESPDQKHLSAMVALLGNNLRYQLSGDTPYKTKVSLGNYPTTYFLVGTLAGFAATAVLHNAYQEKRDEYRTATQLKDFDPRYDSANRLNRARLALAAVTGTAALGTLYFWIKNMTADEIIAADPSLMPYFVTPKKGDYAVGLQIRF